MTDRPVWVPMSSAPSEPTEHGKRTRANQMKSLPIMLAALLCAGCVSSGTMVSEQTSSQFKEGVTTEAQVVQTLGQPQARTIAADGRHILVYSGAQAHATAASYIPVVGIFAGGAKATGTSVVFVFAPNGVLAHMQRTDSQTSASMFGATTNSTTK